MSEKIFGYEWEEIQARQQGTYKAPVIRGPVKKPEATASDKTLLSEFGEEGLREKQFFGVLDRLHNSGLI